MQNPSTRALFEYWNDVRGACGAPDRRDIDPTHMQASLANTFILEQGSPSEYLFRLAGSYLCSAYLRELKSQSFHALWHPRDRDALETIIKAVTQDHAVGLVTFQGKTATGASLAFESLLLPMRHNGSTQARILGAMAALDEPYWLGVQPVLEQRITGLRLFWPDEIAAQTADGVLGGMAHSAVSFGDVSEPAPMPATVFGNMGRRYAHLAVIDGGRI
jgi:hypothetical protein